MSTLTRSPTLSLKAPPPDVSSVFNAHGQFVWLTLQRLGVRKADLDDMLQEVFVVVHRKIHTFDGQSKMTSWLFGICLRVASGYRRKAHIQREELEGELSELQHDVESPEDLAERRAAQIVLNRILDGLSLEQRAVFVMFEIDGLACPEIAALLDVPVGTVYSRLHAARAEFKRAAARLSLVGASS